MAKKNIKTNKSVKENEANMVILDFTPAYEKEKEAMQEIMTVCKEQIEKAETLGRKSSFARAWVRFKTWLKK